MAAVEEVETWFPGYGWVVVAAGWEGGFAEFAGGGLRLGLGGWVVMSTRRYVLLEIEGVVVVGWHGGFV